MLLQSIDIVYVSKTIYLSVSFYELEAGSSHEVARAVVVNAIVLFEVAYLFNSRHLSESILNRRGFSGNQIAW